MNIYGYEIGPSDDPTEKFYALNLINSPFPNQMRYGRGNFSQWSNGKRIYQFWALTFYPANQCDLDKIAFLNTCFGGKGTYDCNAPENSSCDCDPGIDADNDGLNECIDCDDNDGNINTLGTCEKVPDNIALGTSGIDAGDNKEQKEQICVEKEPGGVGDPISLFNGNNYIEKVDLRFLTPNNFGLAFKRFYNSQSNIDGAMGYGWSHNFNLSLDPNYDIMGTTHINIHDASGKDLYFTETNTTRWDGTFGEKSYIIVEADSSYTWHKLDGSITNFSSTGQLQWRKDASGSQQSFNPGANGLLETITDLASDRTLTLHYDAQNRISYISGPSTDAVANGIWVTYGYDGLNNLTSTTYADGSGFTYEYNDPNETIKHNITAKRDKLNRPLATWTYDSQDRAVSNWTPDGEGVNSINYLDNDLFNIEVTDTYNVTRTYELTFNQGRSKVASISGPGGCPTCAGTDQPVRYAYDADFNITEEEYANGTINKFQQYNDRGKPQKIIYAFGTPDERTINLTYHPVLNAKLTQTEESVLNPGSIKETIWDYDDIDNKLPANLEIPNLDPTNKIHRITVKGYTRDAADAIVPLDNYYTDIRYNTKGQVASIDGPISGTQDLISYGYNPATGDLTTISMPNMPQVGDITLQNYDSAGNPHEIIDPNGNSISLGYDARNRLISYQIGGATQTLNYVNGYLDNATDLTGRLVKFVYENNFGRLEKIEDRNQNFIKNTYNTQGDVTEETVNKWVDGINDIMLKYEGYDYNDPDGIPGRLWKIINPDLTYTKLGYDEVGNINSVTDARLKTTGYLYNSRNQLKKTTQPGTIETNYDYDSQGNPKSVTDANSQPSQYEYDDLGRLLSVTSPDSGTTTYRYDVVNNQLTVKDAKNQVATIHYDALGRITAINYVDPTEDISFAYDERTNGKTKLTGMSSPAGTSSFNYNSRGQITSESPVVDGISYSTTYGYEPTTTNMSSMTYPSGMVLTYQRKTDGQLTGIQADGQQLIQDISYLLFGGVEDYTFSGISQVHNRTFDKRYLIDRIQSGAMDYDYTLNAVGDVKNISGKTTPTIVPDETTTFAYLPDTNKIDTVTDPNKPKQYAHDDNGNITSDGNLTFIYNQDNMLVQVKQGETVVADYFYDGFARRVKKILPGQGTTVYHYDKASRLIAEIQSDGTPLVDYIYLENEMVAMKLYGTHAGIYYIQNDHLATPQNVLDSSGQIVWSAAYLPFGLAEVNIETILFNIRFAGQYYDAETGLHYNWNRYYDPETGNYITPDPLGIIPRGP
ncbi:MAG TPA: DUF6531 domain-containing protein, partial [Balneolales bacterium]|nr:DUF6531 domain-containing protein [Balneolales bacterium]